MNINDKRVKDNITTINDISIDNNTNLKEKVVCKNCNNIIFRDLEQYNVYTDILNKEQQNIYAVFVKKFKCSKCKSAEFNSYICDMSLLSKEDKKLNSEIDKNSTEPEIINVDLKSKRTRKKTNTTIASV